MRYPSPQRHLVERRARVLPPMTTHPQPPREMLPMLQNVALCYTTRWSESPKRPMSWEEWCRRGDSNPHGLPRRILSALRMPFRHSGRSEPNDCTRTSSPVHGKCEVNRTRPWHVLCMFTNSDCDPLRAAGGTDNGVRCRIPGRMPGILSFLWRRAALMTETPGLAETFANRTGASGAALRFAT